MGLRPRASLLPPPVKSPVPLVAAQFLADSELDDADSFAGVLLPASVCSVRGAREEKEGSTRVRNAASFGASETYFN